MKNDTVKLITQIENDIQTASNLAKYYLKKIVEFERIYADQTTKKHTGKVVFATLDISFSRWFEVKANNHIRISESERFTNIVLLIEMPNGKVCHINADRCTVVK